MFLKKSFIFCFKLALVAAIFMGLQKFCTSKRGAFAFTGFFPICRGPSVGSPSSRRRGAKKGQRPSGPTLHVFGRGRLDVSPFGQIKKTVLKFYRHTHFRPNQLFKNFSFKKLLLQSDPLPENAYYFQSFNFQSCCNLYSLVKERTGILYVHINKTEGKHKPVTLYDNIGIRYIIDLDKQNSSFEKSRARFSTP